MVDVVWITEAERRLSARILTVWVGYTEDGVFVRRCPVHRGVMQSCKEYLKSNYAAAIRGDLGTYDPSGRHVPAVMN